MKKIEFNDGPAVLRITDTTQQVLSEQDIDTDRPGSILRDFETLLDFIGERGVKTTSKDYLLPQRGLEKLNSEMTRPVAHRLKRPQQRSFPLLNGLYLLLRTTGIGIGIGAPPSGTLALDPELLMMWRHLNPTEQYFALLEHWLIHASTDTIGERDRWSDNCRNSLTGVFNRFARRPDIRIEDSNQRYGIVFGAMDALSIALMDSFGWVSTEFELPTDGQVQQLSRMELLPFGSAMTDILTKTTLSMYPGMPDDETHGQGVLQPQFRPYFPEWKRNLEMPEPEIRSGRYTWRVSVGTPWRRIVIPGELSLDSLADAILQAFDFDNDHLYHFEYRDRRGQTVQIVCPQIRDANAWTDEVAIQDLPLAEGASMTVHFDYGDDWKFTVKLETVAEDDPGLKEAKVIQSSGKAPAQYGWDDE